MRILYTVFIIFIFFGEILGQGVQLRYFEIAFRDKPDSVKVYAATDRAELLTRIEEELRRPEADRRLSIEGRIERGTRYNHYRYDWHFVPNRWTMTRDTQAMSSLAPGRVDDQLSDFLGAEASYRPGESYIVREVNPEEIQQLVGRKSIDIYPNPVAQKLYVQLEDFPHPVRHVVLYDPQGRAVKIIEPAATSPGTLQFSVERLHGGYYTLTIRTEYGRWAKKVLVQ